MSNLALETALGALGIFLLTAATSPPAKAQGISFIRDTEAERVLRNWLDPILVAAELNPQSVHLFIVNDPSINAFVAGGQTVYVHSGLIDAASSANEVQCVIAHELGHITGGHVPLGDRMGKGATGITILSLRRRWPHDDDTDEEMEEKGKKQGRMGTKIWPLPSCAPDLR